jgi:hypothetical protein
MSVWLFGKPGTPHKTFDAPMMEPLALTGQTIAQISEPDPGMVVAVPPIGTTVVPPGHTR